MGSLLGVLLIVIGLLFNQWFLEESIVPDSGFGTRILTVIVVFQVVLVVSGAWLVWHKVRIRVSLLSGSVATILAAVTALGSYRTVVLLLPPPWTASGLSMVERLEMIAQNTTLYPELVKAERYGALLNAQITRW